MTGKISGKTVVVTGSLRPMTRKEVIDFLMSQGAVVQGYVSPKTDILMTGHKQLNLFQPDYRSKKYEAVLQRIAEGQSIVLMTEEDFFSLVRESQS